MDQILIYKIWIELKNYVKIYFIYYLKIKIHNIELPRLLTRIDVAIEANYYSKNKDRKLYINEIEFVPSLFHAGVKYDAIGSVSKQIINIIDIYNKSK